jgi:hypothetical protein
MTPVLHLAAAPAAPASIPGLFRSEEVRRIVEHPPVTRENGFNILTWERANIVDGDRFVIEAWRKHLEIHKDGTFIALGTFSDLLGWPRDGDAFIADPKINSLALIEFTYDFFKTYNAILDYVEPLPLPVRCEIGIRGAHLGETRLWLAPYGLRAVGYEHPFEKKEARSDSVTRCVDVEARTDEPHISTGEVTYLLIEQLYNWFGLTSDVIPYVAGDVREIDPASFLERPNTPR